MRVILATICSTIQSVALASVTGLYVRRFRPVKMGIYQEAEFHFPADTRPYS